jgi:hypothetical protein
MRCGSRELSHGQSRGGQQQDAKVCHDVSRSRKVLESNGIDFAKGFGWSINS